MMFSEVVETFANWKLSNKLDVNETSEFEPQSHFSERSYMSDLCQVGILGGN